MTDMIFQFGQLLYNNTADAAIESIANATGIDKNTITLGTSVVTALGTVAVGTALTFKYGDQCRKKLSRHSSANPTQESAILPTPENPALETPQLGSGEQPKLNTISPEDASVAATDNDDVSTASSTISERVSGGELERKARNGKKNYK